MPTVTLIAAISADGFISRGKGVPWDLPCDKAHFRAHTAGKWLLLSRITYLEMIGWFKPDQTPLVLSLDPDFHPAPGRRVTTVQEAIDLSAAARAEELVVVGGSAAFQLAMPFANKLLMTHIDDRLGTGVPFPVIDPEVWSVQSREFHAADAEHAHAFEFVTYVRVAPDR